MSGDIMRSLPSKPFRFNAALQSLDPAANRFRLYALEARSAPDGLFSLLTWRCRIGSTPRPSEKRFPNPAQLLVECAEVLRRRVQHDYVFTAVSQEGVPMPHFEDYIAYVRRMAELRLGHAVSPHQEILPPDRFFALCDM